MQSCTFELVKSISDSSRHYACMFNYYILDFFQVDLYIGGASADDSLGRIKEARETQIRSVSSKQDEINNFEAAYRCLCQLRAAFNHESSPKKEMEEIL